MLTVCHHHTRTGFRDPISKKARTTWTGSLPTCFPGWRACFGFNLCRYQAWRWGPAFCSWESVGRRLLRYRFRVNLWWGGLLTGLWLRWWRGGLWAWRWGFRAVLLWGVGASLRWNGIPAAPGIGLFLLYLLHGDPSRITPRSYMELWFPGSLPREVVSLTGMALVFDCSKVPQTRVTHTSCEVTKARVDPMARALAVFAGTSLLFPNFPLEQAGGSRGPISSGPD